MLNGVLGVKVGMTQLFDERGDIVPVTVVDINNWFVTQVKTAEKDGYASLQFGLLRERFRGQEFSPLWLKAKKDHFLRIQEIKSNDLENFAIGHAVKLGDIALANGDVVAVTGTSKGLGFQGVVRRWGFHGGPGAHGSRFHRRPGTSGCLRTQGEIIKGKKFPGHMGDEQVTVKGLKIVHVDSESGCIFIKGAVPGKKDSLVVINK